MLKFFENPLVRQYVVVGTVNLCMLVTGMGLVWSSPVLVKLSDSTQNVLPDPITATQGSWIVSITFLAGMTTNIINIFLLEWVGRKFGLILACLPKIIATFLFLFTREVWMLLVGRALIGMSDALVLTLVPMYASEIASKDIRGSLGSIMQILCSIGLVIMFSVGPFVSYINLHIGYACVAVFATVPLFFLPDSPYYLYSKGKKSDAFKVLTYYRGSEALAEEEIKEYEKAERKDENINKKDIIMNRLFLKSLILVIVLGWGCQFVGFNVVTFYLQPILETTQTSVQPEIASVIIGLIQLMGSVTVTFITDKFGRKPILIVTCIGMGVGMLGLGTFFWVQERGEITGFMNFLPLISLILVVYGFSSGLGALFYVLSAELFDDKSRGTGMSINLITTTFFVFITTRYFAQVAAAIGPAYTYWIFSINCVIVCLFVLFCIPETKGRTFAEIQDILRNKLKGDVEEENRRTKF